MSSGLHLPPTPKVILFRPFLAFAAHATSGGVLLLLCTVAALVWANSPWSESYRALWHTDFTVSLAGRALSYDLHFWVNDLLMAVFFLVVGLEIKREVLVGELVSPRQAALPIVAALGGVAVPALLYAMLNDRVPLSLKVFLTALAIADDIAAVLVIAVFYTAAVAWSSVALAGVLVLLLFAANRLGVRHPLLTRCWGCSSGTRYSSPACTQPSPA